MTSPRQDRTRPGGIGAGPKDQVGAGSVLPIVPPGPVTDEVDAPSLWEMNRRAQMIALTFWQSGYERGVDEGRRQVLAETWGEVDDAHAGRDLKALALQPAHADLLDRRGEHEAAEQYRAMLRTRGVVA